MTVSTPTGQYYENSAGSGDRGSGVALSVCHSVTISFYHSVLPRCRFFSSLPSSPLILVMRSVVSEVYETSETKRVKIIIDTNIHSLLGWLAVSE